MWPHGRSKKPITLDADPRADQKYRPRNSRLRGILGLSRGHKHVEPEVQETQLAQRNFPQPVEIVATEIAHQPKQGHSGLGHEPSAEPVMPITALPISKTDEDAVNVGDRFPRDLWQEAAGSLDKKQRILLGLLELSNHNGKSSPQSAVGAIEEVVQKTESSLAAYKNSRKIKRQDGKVLLDVRGNAESILRGTLRVKAIIDAGVKFDPTGYASAAWGIISLGLQLAQNDIDRTNDVFNASAFLTDVLRRYTNIEANYRDQTVPDVEHLEDRIVAVYKSVLEFSANVREHHKMGAGSRILETFYSLDKPALQELKSSVNEADSAMENWRQLIEHEYRIKESAKIEERVNKVLESTKDASAKLSILMTNAEKGEFNDILNWLQTMSTATKHNTNIRIRNPDTAEWIFTNEEYLSWLRGEKLSNRLLWLHGPYGSGKSVLLDKAQLRVQHSANVIHRLLQEQDSYTTCAYWYFDSGISANDTNAALRSVIAQIVGALQIMPNDLRILKAENAVPNREPTREDLLKVFVAAIEEFQSRSDIIIAFDALDECPDRADFLGAITSIMESTRGVRILLTGRPEQDIHSRIVPIATDLVPILNTAGDDVERFVAKELEDETFVRYGKEVQDAVKRKLLGNDDKRFRLASMQIQELKNCWDTSLMYETLDEIPTSIEQAYQNALIKISEKRRKAEKIAAVFEWIYVARRKLTLGELGSALRVEFPEVLLSDCPTCLIRMSDERHEGVTAFTQSWKARTVEFDHSSVRDFLISTRLKVTTDPKLSLYYIDLEKSNVNAAITCLDILLAQCDVNSLDLAVKKQPMLNYAATYWVSHVSPTKSIFNEVSGPLQNPEITRKVLQLFSEGDLVSFLNWLRVYDPDKPTQTNDFLRPLEECAQPLYYAAILGLEKIVEILLSRGAQIKSDKGSFEDAFVAAALQGQVGCLEKMLEAGYALKSLNLYHIIREVKTNAAEVMDVVLGAYLADSTAKARADMAYITDQVVKASVQNSRNATVLINSCAKHNLPIRITRDIALVAKTYYRKVKDAIIFLLRRHQDQHLIIHEDVLIATALKLDGDIMKMALDCTSETAPFSTSTVESLVLAAARITQRNRGAIIALLDRVGDQFRLTETIVNAIASSSWVTKEWIDFLVHRFKSEIPITNQLVLAAARYCDGDVMDILLSRGENVPIDNNIVVAVSQNGDYGLDVIRVLLNRKTEEFQITQELIWTWVAFPRQSIPLIGLLVNIPGTKDLEISKYTVDRALKNNENGVTILKILLQKGHRGTSSDAALEKVMRHFDTDVIDLILDRERQGLISLSEKAIQAAIYNKDYGREIMGLLLDHLGETFPVTEDVVSTVVKELDAEAMKLFLDHHGSKVPVTPRVISCVGENEHNGAQIFQILLKYKEADFDISNELIQASASSKHNAKAMTTHFLSHRGVATLEIDQESAVAVATALDGETMTLLLDLWVESTQLGEPVLYGAVRNEKHGTEIVDILLERYRQCSLTLNVVKAAVNNRLCGRDILSSLLDYDKDLPLSEGAIEIAVANSGVGCEIVSLLLERRPQDFPVTDNILKAIIRNKNCGAEMMSALMSKHGNDIAVTPELLAYAAAWNSVDDAKMVGLLLDLQKAPNLVTEDVLFAAVCCRFDCSPAVLAALLGRQPLDKIPLTATIMANMSPGPLAAFLRHLPKDYIITESMVKAVVLKESSKGQKTSLLLDYRGKDIAITKGLIEAALKSYRGEKVIRLLLYRRGEDFPITKEIVTAIARNYDDDIMTLLLEQRREEVSITSAMLEAAACNYSHGPEMLEVLLSWSPETPVTEKLMIMAGRSDSGPRSMKLIMDKYGKKAPITDEVLKAIIGADRSGKATMEVLFERRGQDIVLTEGVVKHAFLSHGSQRHEVLNALLRGPGQQSKAQITEEAMIALARYFGLEVMTLCLDACGTNVATTAKMIEAAAQNSKYGQDIIKILRSLPSSDFAIGSDAIS